MVRKYSKFSRLISISVATAIVLMLYSIRNCTKSYENSSNFYFQKARHLNDNPMEVATKVSDMQENQDLKAIEIVIEENRKFLEENNVDEFTYSQRKIIFVISTWRSGSTFFGEVFSSHPAIFYHYEPLTRFGFQELSAGNDLENALADLETLSECRYENLHEYMSYVQNDSSIFKFNEKLEPGCQYLGKICYMPMFPSTMCKMFPIQLFKILRIKVSALKPFLQDPTFHVILLLRDPRAIYSSRRKLEWCTIDNGCLDMKWQCDIIKDDLSSIHELKLVYPTQIHLIRYEDVANQPLQEFKKIFSDIDIPWHKMVQNSIELHTQREKDSPWSTFRISQTRVNKWREELKPEFVSYVQDLCWPILDNVSYPRIEVTLPE